jgi:predicted transposase YdaD
MNEGRKEGRKLGRKEGRREGRQDARDLLKMELSPDIDKLEFLPVEEP